MGFKKQTRFSTMLLVIIILGLLISTACNSSKTTREITEYTIGAESSQVVPIILEKAQRIDISVQVKSTSGNDSNKKQAEDIGIMIINPSGVNVVQYMRIGYGDFMVLAEESGTFEITLDNGYAQYLKSVSMTIEYPNK